MAEFANIILSSSISLYETCSHKVLLDSLKGSVPMLLPHGAETDVLNQRIDRELVLYPTRRGKSNFLFPSV